MDDSESGALYAPMFFFASAGWLIYQGQEIGVVPGAIFLLFGMLGAALVVGLPARIIGALFTRLFAGTSPSGAKRAALLVTPPLLLAQAVASFETAKLAYGYLFV